MSPLIENGTMVLIPPSENELQTVRKKLYQDPDVTSKDIKYLREWISKQPHLPQEYDDIWLERFLYGCKYNLEVCKRKLDKYYSVRTLMPEIFDNRDPTSDEMRQTVKTHAQFPLPQVSPQGYRVLFGKLMDFDPDSLTIEAIFRKVVLMGDCSPYLETVHGFVAIVDMEGVTLQHVMKATPSLAKKAVFVLQGAYPFRLKGLYVINVPTFIDVGMKVIKPFLGEKLLKRIHFYTDNYDELFEMIPKEILPNEYGGKAGTVAELNDAWQKKLESCKDVFLKEAAKKTDETKRIGKCSYSEELFGLDGSFRTLTID